MSYEMTTIAKAVAAIDRKDYLLPSIQREFVWKPRQIERLFDSLMQDYPINAFLFWDVPPQETQKFQFYEFLRDYHERDNKHNPKANLNGTNGVTAILDGQQRLTSLYIGLKGSYAYKLRYRRWDDPTAYPRRRLYLNLLAESDEEGERYDIAFLTDDEKKEMEQGNGLKYYFFPVGEILNIRKPNEVNRYLRNNGLLDDQKYGREAVEFASDALNQLYYAIHINETISYYREDSAELDKVLSIFIRINSGGTTLSYSDLLLSFATAQWQKTDAREEIYGLVDDLNGIGRGFNLNKDAILKTCLVLGNFSDISFKVDNFNRSNMLCVEENWDKISNSLRLAVRLVASFGFSKENVTSNNIFIPIAYYISEIGTPANFVENNQYEEDRRDIKKWLVSTLLRRVFSYTPDGTLRPIREIVKNALAAGKRGFPLDEIVNKFKGTNRDISFNVDSIDNLLRTQYGSGDCLVVLSLLYPWADLSNNFHIDHIQPRALFTEKQLAARGYSSEKIRAYLEKVNLLANLELLEAIPNKQKNDKELSEWLEECYMDMGKRKAYLQKHYIPEQHVGFDDFEKFFEEREKLLRSEIAKALR